MNVTVRKKKISKGRESVFLDITYQGKRVKHYLQLFLYTEPQDAIERKHNKVISQRIEKLKVEHLNALKKSCFEEDISNRKIEFLDYYAKLLLKRQERGTDVSVWKSALSHFLNLEMCQDKKLYLIDMPWLDKLKNYLLNEAKSHNRKTRIGQNTAKAYFNKVVITLKEAFYEGIIPTDISSRVRRITEVESEKDYLTVDELSRFMKLEVREQDAELHKACVFSALTGLRSLNVKRLTWGNIFMDEKGNPYMRFEQVKRKNQEHLYILKEAFELIQPINSDSNQKVFPNLKYNAHNNLKIREWVLMAEIPKRITFHNFRHTYGSLLYQNTHDIYLTSRMLGHKNIKSTIRYAKTSDAQQVSAITKFSNNLNLNNK